MVTSRKSDKKSSAKKKTKKNLSKKSDLMYTKDKVLTLKIFA